MKIITSVCANEQAQHHGDMALRNLGLGGEALGRGSVHDFLLLLVSSDSSGIEQLLAVNLQVEQGPREIEALVEFAATNKGEISRQW